MARAQALEQEGGTSRRVPEGEVPRFGTSEPPARPEGSYLCRSAFGPSHPIAAPR